MATLPSLAPGWFPGPGAYVTVHRYHRLMAMAAYLRVYLPVERIREPLDPVTPAGTVPRRLVNGAYGVWYESMHDDAFVLQWEGRSFMCPRNPRLRILEGVLAFHNAYRGPTAAMLVPEETAERAARELRRIQDRSPWARSHILTSPFAVPLRWFAAFDPTERILGDASGSTTIRYRTRVRAAVKRLRRTVDILEGAGFDEVVVDQVAELLAWVDAFPKEGILELDYGGVAALFSDADLALDESAAEVAASLDALEEEDYDAAGEHYSAAASRWAHAQSLAYVN